MSATRAKAVNFSSMFEHVCNFVAVSEIGDPQTIIMGLVKLCLLSGPARHFYLPSDFAAYIEMRFGIVAAQSEIESAIQVLTDTDEISLQGNQYYILNEDPRQRLQTAIDQASKLESEVKNHWREEIAQDFQDPQFEKAWSCLRKYLSRTFRRHGIQAASLLDPSLETPVEYEESLTSILTACLEEDFSDTAVRDKVSGAISSFLTDVGRESERTRYIIQLANAAFAFYTVEIAPEAAATLRSNINPSVVFLDTNFLFGILGLHNNSQVDVSLDLVEAVSKYDLPFQLRYHEATLRELERTLHFYGEKLKSRNWTRALSNAAVITQNVSGIELKFHEMNQRHSISPEDFLRPYQHCDVLLHDKGIKAYEQAIDQELATEEAYTYHEYDNFLSQNKRSGKTYETKMHDAKVLVTARKLRANARSSLEAGALLITCDYYLYRFDRRPSKEASLGCVLFPNTFWQIISPLIPKNENFDRAFAETFALPELRTIDSQSAKAGSRMLAVLASYANVSEETAVRMMSNDMLLRTLKFIDDDEEFEKAVEKAFIEENQNLIEETAAKDQVLAEKEKLLSRKDEEIDALKQKSERDSEYAARKAIDSENRIGQALRDKEAAEKKAERIARATGILTSTAMAAFFAIIIRYPYAWDWLLNHKNSYGLQACSLVIIFCGMLSVWFKPWRKYLLPAGVIGAVLGAAQLLGGPHGTP